MDSIAAAAAKLTDGLQRGCADDIVEVLCNLADGTCDAVQLIPVLEQIARRNHFHYFDDNGAGGLPHASGKASEFRDWARAAIENIKENQRLQSPSPFAASLKSPDTDAVQFALDQVVHSNCDDATLLPILEKISRKDKYDSYSYYGGYGSPRLLGAAARKAIQRIRDNAGIPACSLCGSIPDATSANTGRDEHFGPPVTLLKQHRLGNDDDLLECPQCGDLFLWHDYRSQTGSGNNDEETLARLSSLHAATLREIVHRGERAIDDPPAVVGRLARLPRAARDLAAIHLRQRDRELARLLVPALVDSAASGDSDWFAKFLISFTSTPEDAALVLGVLDSRTASSPLAELRAHARAAACSICRSIRTYPPTKTRRGAPPFAKLKPLGASERNDVWECPECDALLHWQSEDGVEGGLTRVASVLANAVRQCAHRSGAVDERAIETVFACGREWQQLLVFYGIRSDPAFIMQMVPRMVLTLARDPQPWMRDALYGIAQDPFGAKRVLSEIARLDRTNGPLDSVAARARASLAAAAAASDVTPGRLR